MIKRITRMVIVLLTSAAIIVGLGALPASASSAAGTGSDNKYEKAKKSALSALNSRMNEAIKRVYVYKDYGLTENNFTTRSKMFGNDGSLLKDMNENWTDNPYKGTSCIRCEQTIKSGNWSGWQMLNGYMKAGSSVPLLNTGNQPGQGLNLAGADALHFFARAETPGVKIEAFTAGFGYDGSSDRKLVDYPDSTTKKSLGWIELTEEWKEYVIPLKKADMSYIVCGFGYVTNDQQNQEGKCVFYLDEIYFSGNIRSARKAPVLLRSYDTDKDYLKNAAYSYDNALAAMAYISEGKKSSAKKILDAFIYAINNDRTYLYEGYRLKTRRLRNAYAAGNISAFPGWQSGTRLPGWYDRDTNTWKEDSYGQLGTNVGNISYVSLAMLQYYNRYGGKKYLKAASTLMDWVINNCSDDGDGFTSGIDGGDVFVSNSIIVNKFKSTECNIDCYSAFDMLWSITQKKRYEKAAESAMRFVKSMYDEENGVFFVGTKDDGKTPNKDVTVLDTQVWCALAFGEEFEPYKDSLKAVEKMKTADGGYSFCLEDTSGAWCEGTSFTGLMYRELGDEEKYLAAMDTVISVQQKKGMVPAATVDGLFTGIYLSDGTPWKYYSDPHLASTCWLILAINNMNPYVLTEG